MKETLPFSGQRPDSDQLGDYFTTKIRFQEFRRAKQKQERLETKQNLKNIQNQKLEQSRSKRVHYV